MTEADTELRHMVRQLASCVNLLASQHEPNTVTLLVGQVAGSIIEDLTPTYDEMGQ